MTDTMCGVANELPDYQIVPGSVRGFPPVEKIYVGGKCVGMLYRDPEPPAELDELWMAYTEGGHGADSREDAIAAVLAHAMAYPDFMLK